MSPLMSRARFILALTVLVLAAAVHADASPTIQVPSTFCPGGTGVATLSAPDGGGSWASVQWSITNGTIVSSQGSTLTFRNQSTALITIGASATDTNGGTFTANPATVVVHQTTAPDLDTKGSVCIGGNGTAVVRNAASYPSPITWQVTNGTITANRGASIDYTAGTSGVVLIRATTYDSNGCEVAAQWQVYIVPPPSAQITVSASACPGSFDATVPDAGLGALYDWSIQNGAIISGAGTRQIRFVPSNGNAVTLEATVTEYFRGCSTHGTYTGQFVPVDGPQIVLDRTSACPGSSVQASIEGTYSSVHWSVTNGYITADNGNSITFQVNGWGGPAQVSVDVSNGQGCSAYDAEEVAVSWIEPPAITFDKTSACPGQGVVTATVDGDWSNIYWSVSNGEVLTQSGSTATLRSTSWSSGMTVGAYVTDAGGCSAFAGGVQIPLRTIEPPTITVDKPSVCPGQGVVTATVSGAWSSIYWSVNNGEILNQSGNTVTVRSTTWNAGIDLAAWVSDAEGCSAYTNSVQIPLRTIEPPTITVDKPSVCPGFGVVTATVGGTWSNIYWSAVNGEILGQNGNSVTVRSTNWSSGIELAAWVSDAEGCNTYTNSVQIPLRTIEPPTITVDKTSVCPSFGVVTATIDGDWSDIYWSPINGEVLSQNGNSVTVRSTSWALGIELNVYVRDAEGCSTFANSVTLPLRVLEPPVITVDKPSVCAGVGVVTATIGGDWSNIYWSPLNGEVVTQNGNSVTVRSTSWSSGIELNVYVNDAEGCNTFANSVMVPLRVIEPPVITVDKPSICPLSGVVTATVGGDWSTIYWSPVNGEIVSQDGNSVTVRSTSWSSAIELTASVMDSQGCRASTNSVQIPLSAVPTVTAGGPATFCEGGSVVLTAPAGMAGYLWSNGAITQSITVTASGAYSVTTTDAYGCALMSAAAVVTVNPLPATAITAGGPTTFCEGGSVTLTAPASTSYSWSNGATTRSITVDASGAYSVTVTNANGCSATSTPVVVTENPLPAAPVIAAGGPTTFCAGGSVTLNAPAGFTYLWSTGATTQSITVSQAGQYSVSVTNANGCSSQGPPVTVTVNPLPVATVTAGGPTTFCEGGSVTLTASAGSSYLWSNGATTQAIDATASGSYSVTVTNANGCSATSAATSVTVNPLPTPSISASGPTTFCQGGSVTLTGQGGAPSGAWYRNGSLYSAQAAIVVNSSATFVYRVQTAAGCTADSAPTVVTVNPLPSISSAGGHGSVCDNETVYWQVDNPTAGASIVWTVTGGVIVSGQGEARVYYQAEAEAASVHLDVLLTSTAGCTKSYGYDIPVYRPTPTISAEGPATFCAGGSVTLTASAAPSGWTYLWSNGATTQSIAVSAGGTYTVRYRSVTCNAPLSAPVTVTVNPLPAATITPSGATTFCEGGSVTLTASAGASYLWSTGASTQSINVTSSGNYSVTVTSAAGCSKTSAATAVTVNALPVATITPSGPTTFCAGGSVTLTASAGSTYLWSTGATTSSIDVTSSGSYSVTVTNAAGCSRTSAATAVTVNALPVATITPSGPTTFCAGGSVTLTASSGSSYLWSNGATTSSINVTTSGSYSVTVNSANGCSTTSAATAVTVNALPAATITPSGPTTFCAGGSVTLTASAGSSYLWSNGATTSSIDVTSSGNYSVTVTSAAGCSKTSAATAVTVNALPTATITSGPTTFCAGGSVTLIASSGSSYLWSTGATTSSINVTSSGSYSVTVTNANGCSATSAPTVVTVNAMPVATITPSGPTTFCAGGSVTLTASAGASYLWSNGATTPSINVTSSGSYSVTVTSAAGCFTTSATTPVTVNALPTATITSGPTTFCEGGSVTLVASFGSSYLWSTGATTQSITATAAGSYSVTVTNGNGCSATSAATNVTVNPLPTSSISASGPTTFCPGGSVTLTGQGGTTGEWLRDGALYSSQNPLVVTAAGSYVYRAKTAAGCEAVSAPAVVTLNPLPSIYSAGGNGRICDNATVYWEVASPTPGATIFWTVTGGVIVSGQNEARLYYHADPQAASVHLDVQLTSTAGCAKTWSYDIPVDRPTPTISASGPTTFCAGGSVTLTASAAPAGWTYVWSNFATTQSINVTAGGTYTVHYYRPGCDAPVSAPVTVTVDPLPAATITPSGPTTFCAGGAVTLTASAGASYFWSTGATTQAINVTTGGNYTVTVTSAAGCSATSAPRSVTVNAAPSTPVITAGGPTTFCAGGSVTLSAPAGFTYLWSTGATTQSINVTTTGNYTVTVTNAGGCSAISAPKNVTVNAATAITQQPPNPTIPKNTATTLTVTATGSGTLAYQWYKGTSPSTTTPISGATGNSYTTPSLTKGTYKYWVRVTGTCGVVNSNTATVTAN